MKNRNILFALTALIVVMLLFFLFLPGTAMPPTEDKEAQKTPLSPTTNDD